MYTIYLITNKVNGKVYVGQTNRTLGVRWYNHKYDAIQRNEDFPICRAIRKYGPENFTIEELATGKTREWSDYLERVWILLYDSRNDKIGYNVREGGNSSSMPESTKQALRQSRLGKTHSEKTRKLIGEASKRAWIDGRMRGVPHTEATKELLRNQRLENKSHVWKRELNGELLVFLYNNHITIEKLSEAFASDPKTISRHLRSTKLPLRKPERAKGKDSPRYKPIDEALLSRLYEDRFSVNEISKRLGCQWNTTMKRIKSLGLSRSEAA